MLPPVKSRMYPPWTIVQLTVGKRSKPVPDGPHATPRPGIVGMNICKLVSVCPVAFSPVKHPTNDVPCGTCPGETHGAKLNVKASEVIGWIKLEGGGSITIT
jgi:hypothetical protein